MQLAGTSRKQEKSRGKFKTSSSLFRTSSSHLRTSSSARRRSKLRKHRTSSCHGLKDLFNFESVVQSKLNIRRSSFQIHLSIRRLSYRQRYKFVFVFNFMFEYVENPSKIFLALGIQGDKLNVILILISNLSFLACNLCFFATAKLAACLVTQLPGCLAAWLPGCLAAWLPVCLSA